MSYMHLPKSILIILAGGQLLINLICFGRLKILTWQYFITSSVLIWKPSTICTFKIIKIKYYEGHLTLSDSTLDYFYLKLYISTQILINGR